MMLRLPLPMSSILELGVISKIYTLAKGRQLEERFREHHRDVGMTNTHLKQSSDTLIIPSYIASKLKEKKVSFKLVLLTPAAPPRPFIIIQCWESRLIFRRLAKNDDKIYNGFHKVMIIFAFFFFLHCSPAFWEEEKLLLADCCRNPWRPPFEFRSLTILLLVST